MARVPTADGAPACSWLDLGAILGLALVVSNFFLEVSFQHPRLAVLFAGAWRGAAFFVGVVLLLSAARLALASRVPPLAALITLSPTGLLLFWPAHDTTQTAWIPLAIVVSAQVAFWRVLTKRSPGSPRHPRATLAAVVAAYLLAFAGIGLWQIEHFEVFNPRDWTVYNQSFWTTVHGHFFVNSIYTSYFAGHTTWFFFSLVPFYYLFPDPRTLLIAKLLLLSLSAVPFRLIARDLLGGEPPVTLTLCFLLFPFVVTQNLNAPHEMGYAPFFLLWTYWFYRTDRFAWFVLLLLLTLSIKEHLAAVAVAFGGYAWWKGRSRRWVAVPIALGLVIGTFSIWFIAHMQQVYHDPGNSSWVMVSFKQRFAASGGSLPVRLIRAAVPSILTTWDSLHAVLLLVVPLGAVPPFLSGIWLLGLPELALNLVIDRPAIFSPIWHYNVAAACFLLVAAVDGLGKIAGSRFVERLELSRAQAVALLAAAMCALVLVHSYTWLGFVTARQLPLDLAAVRHAIAAVPRDAFITAPERILPAVSGRDKLSILGEGSPGEFVLVDQPSLPQPLASTLASSYLETFDEDGIRVYRRVR